MHELLKLLSDYQLEVEARAFAHYASSNDHRRKGVLWGIAASGLSGTAGLATLAGAAMQLEPVKAALAQLGPSSIPKIAFLAVVLFAFAIASALEAFLAHPKQAASHMTSYAGYSHAMRRLETLRIRCANPSIANSELSSLLNLLDDISQEIRAVAAASIYPVPEAYKKGKEIKQSDLAFSKDWETTFGPRSSNVERRLIMRKTILLADNDSDFRRSVAELLEQDGYRVLLANDPAETRRLLENSDVDLAVIDVRLEDDSDANDFSGLEIAEETALSIPKIILTSYPTVETIRKALRFRADGLPAAVDFLAKQEGPERLLASVRRSAAVYSDKSPKRVVFDLSAQLERDYEESRKQAIFTHRVRLILAVVGSLVIIGGAAVVLLGQTTAGGLSVLSGVIVEALAGLFSKISEDANKRMDRYHEDLLKLYMDQK